MHPVSSFTSMTKALISVSSASRTSCHSLGEPKAHALTYSALIEAGAGPRMGCGCAYRSSMGRSATFT